jgi:methylmalonyl-CoA mutase C-terminal domain/subunit
MDTSYQLSPISRQPSIDRQHDHGAPAGAILPAMPRRILIAKPGLDGHDRGAKVIARALRDAGHEVIYSGLHQTPEQIVETAIQEDVDAIGLSVLSGAHMTLFPRVVEILRQRDIDDIVVFGGGIVPDVDIAKLKEAGLAKIFTPGAPLSEITDWVANNISER